MIAVIPEDRQRSQQREQRERAVRGAQVECVPIISMMLDEQGLVSHVNSAWQRVLGYTVEETRLQPLSRFMPADSVYQITAVDFPKGNELVKFELPLLTKTLNIMWFAYYAHRGSGDAISGYLIDITSAQMVAALDQVIHFASDQLEQAGAAIGNVRNELEAMVPGAGRARLAASLSQEVERLQRLRIALLTAIVSPAREPG